MKIVAELLDYAEYFLEQEWEEIPLWESVYLGERDVLKNEVTCEVSSFYRRYHWTLEGHIPDQLGVELMFYAWLYERAEAEETRPEETKKKWFWRLSKLQFFREHLYPFVQRAWEQWGVDSEQLKGCWHLLEKEKESLESKDGCSLPARHLYSADYAADTENVAVEWITKERVAIEQIAEDRITTEQEIWTGGRNNCGNRCVMKAVVKEDCLLRLVTPKDCKVPGIPYQACARGREYRHTFLSPKRLAYPMKRVGKRGEGKFERIGWEEATDWMAKEFTRIREIYGPGARYVNYSSGIAAVMSGEDMAKRLFALDGGFLNDQNDYSAACTTVATPYTYGTIYSGNSPSDLLNSRLILLWGHNPVETGFGAELVPNLMKAKQRGIPIVVIDPRCSDTAKTLGDQWIPIRPSTDGALMLAMAYVILAEGLEDRQFMNQFCLGFDQDHMPAGCEEEESFEEYVFGRRDGIPKTPEWAESIAGVDRTVIAALAREYANAKPAALLQGYGMQRHGNGEQSVRCGTMLACLTGNVGIPGGSAAGKGKIVHAPMPKFPVPVDPYPGIIPTFLWTDAIVRGRSMTAEQDGVQGMEQLAADIKCIINIGGNTLVNQHSDINKTIEILADESLCECIVCSDLFLTPSALYADLLLPGTSMLEGANITVPWTGGGYLIYQQAAVKPLAECRFEYDWLCEVADKMGIGEAYREGNDTVEDWLRTIYETTRKQAANAAAGLPELEEFKARGQCRYPEEPPYIAFQKQREDPVNYPFPTPSGKIEIYSKALKEKKNPGEIPAIPQYVISFDGPEDSSMDSYPYNLIGWHTKRRTHSIQDISSRLESLEPQQLWMHPEDALDLGLQEGELALVGNHRGEMVVPVHITKRIIKGTTALPQGAYYTPNARGQDMRGNINIVATQRPTPLAKGNPQHSNRVAIRKYTESM